MNNIDYLDPEQFNNPNDKLDFKFILMRQIDKIRIARSMEMRPGYWEDRNVPMSGGFMNQRVYLPDSREVYVNSVKALRTLLIPYRDEKFIKKEKEIISAFEEIERKEINRLKALPQLRGDKEKLYEVLNSDKGYFLSEFKPEQDVMKTDLIFEILLQLCQRAKLIGGNRLVTDEV